MTRLRVLAAAAVVLAALAAVAGEPVPRADRALAAALTRGEGRTDVITVAGWIRARLPGLVLVDLRPAAEFAAGPVVPGAVNRTVEALATMPADPAATLVLYADRPALAGQAWLLLRQRGHREVFYLEHGLEDWEATIVAPVLPDSATADELAAWPAVAELSRYFGGLPFRGGPRPPGQLAWLRRDGAPGVRTPGRVRRVGCGF